MRGTDFSAELLKKLGIYLVNNESGTSEQTQRMTVKGLRLRTRHKRKPCNIGVGHNCLNWIPKLFL